jgi:molecular chaperone Hsp33
MGDTRMSELHKFLFDTGTVRGMLVRLTGSWQELLARHAQQGGDKRPYPAALRSMLGEMAAASVLMQASIKFNGALTLQIHGDGPVKLAVAEANPDLSFRATAKVVGDLGESASLPQMVNAHNRGQCAITLSPKDPLPGQQPYQGVVPLFDDQRQPLGEISEVLAHYMLQSEQLDTRMVLAANDELAVGLLIQRLPQEGGRAPSGDPGFAEGSQEDFNRVAHLLASMSKAELLSIDAETTLRRLFWQEPMQRLTDPAAPLRPHFACTCSRVRVGNMLRNLGRAEVDGILAEQGHVEVGCDFCGAQYRFDAVDAQELFVAGVDHPPGTGVVQ